MDWQSIAARFASSLDGSLAVANPYRHWLLEEALPIEAARAIAALPFAAPLIGETLGKRETHNSTRTFFSQQNQQAHAICDEVARAFQAPQTIDLLQRRTGAALEGNYLRIEYCQDRAGFWLEPHTDIGAKKFTMLVYLSDTPEAEQWGTDIFDRELRQQGQAPGGFDKGLIFIPADDTWHGVVKRDYAGIRKSIIINYVKPEWRARHELAFPNLPVAC
jgi:hypothetical protein